MDTVYVYTMKELKEAVKQKRERIIVRGKLAKRLRPLAKIKGTPNVHTGMSKQQFASTMMVTTAVPAAVWIALIITVGITVLVALLLGYNATVKVGDNELIFDKK